MTLLGFSIALKFARKHRDAQKWLTEWATAVRVADWSNLADVHKVYPHADGVKLKSKVVVTVFNVKGNEYRLLTAIDYELRSVLVLDVLTHGDYSRELWTDRL